MAGYIGSKASVVSSGAERKQTYSITTTTTSLTGLAYTPTKVHVYHNGIRLVDTTDYTATNGTSITLTNAAEDGDEVVVISYATFKTSDTVSAANGGTFAGNVEISKNSGNATLGIISGDSNNSILYMGDQSDENAGYIQYSNSDDFMLFRTNNSEAMRIDDDGNVGIGTSSPSYPLTVQKDVDAYIAKLENDGNSTSSNGLWVDTRWNTATNTVFKVTTNSGSVDVLVAKGDGNVSRPSQSAFHARTSTAEDPAVNGDISFDTELLDNNADYNTSNGRFTAPVDGIYTFTSVLSWAGGDGVDDSMTLLFNKNGSTYATYPNDPNYFTRTGIEMTLSYTCVIELAANDYVTAALSGVAASRPAALLNHSHFMGHLI